MEERAAMRAAVFTAGVGVGVGEGESETAAGGPCVPEAGEEEGPGVRMMRSRMIMSSRTAPAAPPMRR